MTTSLEILQTYLESLSFRVTTVDSGEAALALLEQANEHFESGDDGLAHAGPRAASRLPRRSRRGSDLTDPPKIILVSGFAGEEVMAQGRRRNTRGQYDHQAGQSLSCSSMSS